ncbi:MAG TPA: hypothetical protein VET84_04910 [Stellaceae bacterium]|nr:hypothetical protein [Stellaceae bacterium]
MSWIARIVLIVAGIAAGAVAAETEPWFHTLQLAIAVLLVVLIVFVIAFWPASWTATLNRLWKR